MRKRIAFILALLCILALFGCSRQANTETETKEYQFRATVIEVSEEYLLVEAEKGSKAYNFSDQYRVGIKDDPSWPIPQVGDVVTVVYNGFAHASAPAEITHPYRVEILETADTKAE